MGRFTAFREDVYPRSQITAFPASDAFAMACAAALAWAAQLAYEAEDPDKLTRILGQWRWQHGAPFVGVFHKALPFTLASGYAAQAGRTTIVAFAGTEPDSAPQWIQNFAARPVDGMHEGFAAGAEALWNEDQRTLQRVVDAADEIYLCGHSLGGALAVSIAHRLCRSKPEAAAKIRGVYTMGMPRIGTESFAQAYSGTPLGQRTFRLVHGEDLVPHVPPKLAPFGYRHVGRALACPRGGTFAPGDLGPPTTESADGDAAISLGDIVPRLFPDSSGPGYPAENAEVADLVAKLPPILRDHLMDRYLLALGAL